MASYNLFIVLAIASVTATMASTQFWVGGPSGWTNNVDYQAWAADKVFHVGDTLGIVKRVFLPCIHKHTISAKFHKIGSF